MENPRWGKLGVVLLLMDWAGAKGTEGIPGVLLGGQDLKTSEWDKLEAE